MPTRCSGCCKSWPRSARRRSAAGRGAMPTSASPSSCPPTRRRSSSWSTGRSRSRRATSATSTSPRSPTGSTPATATQFAASLAQVGRCEGVALMAPDLPPVKLAINELVRSGVHVVTLFSDVAGSMRETHVGADSRAAGRTAGLLLGAHGERLAARHAAARLAGDAPVGRDRAPDRLRPGARGALPDAAHAAPARPARRATRRRGARSRASCRRASTRRASPASTTSARAAPAWRARSTAAGPGRRRRRWPRTT